MKKAMNAPYPRQVFVCTSGKVCPTQGSEAVHARLKEAVFAAGLGDAIRVNKAGCMAQCGYGPVVVVHPENRWYAPVTAADVAVLFAEEVLAGRPVPALLYRPEGPGKNVCEPGEKPGTLPPLPPVGT
jgi:(2Fe-2S) ferredoxin